MVLKYSKAAYKKRVAVERVLSRLKNVASLTQRKSEEIGQSHISFSALRLDHAFSSPSNQ